MAKRTRYILIISLFTTFSVVAPLVLSFASGYRYNWQKNTIEKTGIISVDTDPSGATVYIDGSRSNETTPVSITRLLPEEYDVEIRLDGFLPWKKTLIVESGRTTFAKKVSLIQDVLPRVALQRNIVESVFNFDGGGAAYIAADEQWAELTHRDFETNKNLLLSRFGIDKYSDIELSMSPNGSRLMMKAIVSETKERSIIIYEMNVAGTTSEVSGLVGSSDLNYCWADNANLILATDKKVILAGTDRDTQTLFASSTGIIRDVLCTRQNYWLLLEKNDGLHLTKIPKDNPLLPEDIAVLENGDRRFVSGKEDLLWLSGDGLVGGLAIKTGDGSSFRTPDATGISWEYSDNNGRVLLWNDFEIFMIDFVKPEPELITRLGTPIHDVAWSPNGSYALFVTDTGITAIGLDSRDRRNIFRLVEFSTVDSMAVNEDANLLRFVGSIGNQRGIYERPL